MGKIEDRLEGLGLSLPPAKRPVANYTGRKRSGELLFVSGLVSERRGQVSSEVSLAVKAAAYAARSCSASSWI